MKALEAIHSSDALDQLLRVLNSDPGVLKDAGEYEALSRAVASYGADAKLKLLDIFTTTSPETNPSFTLGGDDLYTRYFSLPAEALRSEISSQTTDSTTRQAQLAKMDDLISTMKTNLAEIQNPPAGKGFTTQDFVLDTMMQMSMNSDADLKNFAGKTAANTAFSDEVRGKALLLIARFGEKGDMGLLYPFLQSKNDYLKAKALEGITNLQMKISGSPNATATP
jgi:hypothetical protein